MQQLRVLYTWCLLALLLAASTYTFAQERDLGASTLSSSELYNGYSSYLDLEEVPAACNASVVDASLQVTLDLGPTYDLGALAFDDTGEVSTPSPGDEILIDPTPEPTDTPGPN